MGIGIIEKLQAQVTELQVKLEAYEKKDKVTKERLPYNPFSFYEDYDLDYAKGTLRVIKDGESSVIFLQQDNGNVIVLNVILD